ncbi:MAG: FmdB family zinc ribbon protein [Phycisphaerales bacterium]
MPTDEYQCDACGHEMEEFQSITARPLKKCPECGKQKLKRLIGTGAGIIFKGSGFYETDYRSKDYAKAKEADSKAATDSSKSDDSKSEKTGDAKPKKSEKTESKPKAKTTSDA